MDDLGQKWDAIYRQREGNDPEPATVLSQYTHLLPTTGLALDLACGLGGNAFLLAQHGLCVDAWDISSVAIEKIKKETSHLTQINAEVTDVAQAKLANNHYDVIVVSRFLDRQIVPKLISALKPQGLIFYQTFTLAKSHASGPSNPRFLLRRNELLSLFSELITVIYREDGNIGNTQLGLRNEAMLVAQKP
ncbi:MAG: methyltransferase domain-containing protein [Cycloclasticus sp.]|nr:methyltransferase domain-containing protein [Cycloclasticus sp.]MBQ0789087.1 methyltransferase domain-containing protein [Cycloclasticus sp.]